MRKNLPIIILIFLLVFVSGCRAEAETGDLKTGTGDLHEKTGEGTNPSHPSSFVTSKEFYALLDKESASEPLPGGRIVSAVAPHHLVAGELILKVMQVIAKARPELVIVVGPNHENSGGKVITGLYDWETPAGKVHTETKVAGALLEKGLAVRDEKVLSREHSVGTHMPFIRHYLPEARVVPLILHHGVSLEEVDELLTALEPYLGEKTLILSSVDFSHYLTRQEAEAKDKETQALMKAFNYPTLFRLGNDYLDSPASLAFALRQAQKQGIKDFALLDNTNSGIIMRNDFIETTSYFTLVFSEE
jgi:AmmeMemoRadiSam system protein B